MLWNNRQIIEQHPQLISFDFTCKQTEMSIACSVIILIHFKQLFAMRYSNESSYVYWLFSLNLVFFSDSLSLLIVVTRQQRILVTRNFVSWIVLPSTVRIPSSWLPMMMVAIVFGSGKSQETFENWMQPYEGKFLIIFMYSTLLPDACSELKHCLVSVLEITQPFSISLIDCI